MGEYGNGGDGDGEGSADYVERVGSFLEVAKEIGRVYVVRIVASV